MSYLAWIVIGLAGGVFVGRLLDRPPLGIAADAVLGMAGAVTGGWLYNTYGRADAIAVTSLSVNSVVVAILGAALLLLAHHAATQRSS